MLPVQFFIWPASAVTSNESDVSIRLPQRPDTLTLRNRSLAERGRISQ
jgi:hypothetical protein